MVGTDHQPGTGGEPEDGISDEDLALAAQDGSMAAFEVLVQRYRDRVYGLALRMTGQPSDADDVAQDTFVTAWRKLDELDAPGAVRTWMFRIATTTSLALIRRRKRMVPVPDPAEGRADQDPAGDPAVRGELSARLGALEAAVVRLPARQRAVWVLIELEGLSYAEAADAVGTSPDAVRGQLFRARAKLAEVMSPWS